MSDCTHDCSSCGESCGERTAPQDFRAPANGLSHIGKVIAVVSGKGGVGKSLVTSSLAVAMRRMGKKVGVLDADITGPSIPTAFGVHEHATGSEFGICNVFLEREMPTYLHCKVRTGVAFLPTARFIALLERDSALLRRYLALCNRKILYLADKVELMGIPTCGARLAAYLLRQADETGFAEIDVSKEQLAKYLSVSRASLFRALGALTAQGLIVPEGAGYRITDPTALGRI